MALFDVESITLTGAVPDQAAKDRLQALAIANAKPGQATNVANFVTINPAVPRSSWRAGRQADLRALPRGERRGTPRMHSSSTGR